MRAARFLTCKMPRPAIRTRSPFLFGDQADQIVEHGLPAALGHLVFGGQTCREMFQGDGSADLGGSRVHRGLGSA
jgi:hypothetical protein